MHAIRVAALSFRALIATKLGACALCIRLSLTLSVVSWLLLVVINALVPGSLAAKLALVPALAFAALFASHLAAYAVRVLVAYGRAGRVASGLHLLGKPRGVSAFVTRGFNCIALP